MPYERFTDRARKVMKLAEQEARRFNHDYIGIYKETRHGSPRFIATDDPNCEISIVHSDEHEFCVLDFLPRCERIVEAARERRERKFGTEGGDE